MPTIELARSVGLSGRSPVTVCHSLLSPEGLKMRPMPTTVPPTWVPNSVNERCTASGRLRFT